MSIQSAVYTNADRTLVLINGRQCIPVDPTNRDYRKLIEPYLAAGGIVDDFTPPEASTSLRDAAVDALLAQTAKLQDCPPEVKDYVDAKTPDARLK